MAVVKSLEKLNKDGYALDVRVPKARSKKHVCAAGMSAYLVQNKFLKQYATVLRHGPLRQLASTPELAIRQCSRQRPQLSQSCRAAPMSPSTPSSLDAACPRPWLPTRLLWR